MKLSHAWLRSYVDPGWSAAELGRRLTFAGFPLDGLHDLAAGLAGVVVAEVVSVERHPQADRLFVYRVNDGGSAPRQVVAGIDNAQPGQRIPLALPGTKIDAGPKGAFEVGARKMRGVESHGMLCAADELGHPEWDTDPRRGLWILPAEVTAAPGTPLAQALGRDDAIFDLDIYPNRPDALGHLGVAREIAALSGAVLRAPEPTLSESGAPLSPSLVEVRDTEGCPRYIARVIEGVTIGPSPAWLRRRLEAVGLRSINNVVDLTNFVLLETAHPIHAFDQDALAEGRIVVRRAAEGEALETLDGQKRALDGQDLVIADARRPVALAGIMGGEQSGVGPRTRRVLLEVAYFDPGVIRRGARRHAIHTDSSHRFERGVDVARADWVSRRAAALIAEVAGGTVRPGCVDVWPSPPAPRTVRLRPARLAALLGARLDPARVEAVLRSLGLEPVGPAADGAAGDDAGARDWRVPSWRVDLEREADLAEEVARIIGYDALPSALPARSDVPGDCPDNPVIVAAQAERLFDAAARDALVAAGFVEHISLAFDAATVGDRMQWPADADERRVVAIANPLTEDLAQLRTSLLPGLLAAAARNLARGTGDVRLFEVGAVFHARGGDTPPDEPRRVAGVLCGRRWSVHPDLGRDTLVDPLDARAAAELVCEALRAPARIEAGGTRGHWHPRRSGRVFVGERCVGAFGELHPLVAGTFELGKGAVAFELALDQLGAHRAGLPRFRELPRFPGVSRDLALLVDSATAAERVTAVALAAGAPLLEQVTLFDVYRGKGIPAGKKSVAIALAYRHAERTLTDDEVGEAQARVVAALREQLGAELRA